MRNEGIGSLLFLVGLLAIVLFFLKGVSAEGCSLRVQNVEINPAVAEIGEHVSIKMKIRNIQKDDAHCNVTVFCGDCGVDTKKIKVAGLSSEPLSFELDTSLMPTGVYSIEALIQEQSGQQKIFDLGSIPLEEHVDLTVPDDTEPEQITPAYFNWQFLLPVAAAGAAASVLVLRKQRNKSQDLVAPEKSLPHIFNEILKSEERVETGTHDAVPQHEKKYIA